MVIHCTPESGLRSRILSTVLCCSALFLPIGALAYLNLADARLERLDNGMTLIVLEEHGQPLVSVQMLYRVGARNETAGATGLAHFLEHMAFRDSEHFPETQLVSSIYAAGGEWHGYTWLDQTTYYATAPKAELDLLLRIEADRMSRLDISEADVIVERGAVITEMHSYENDPASVLHDNAMYLAFLAHPYRNNTIGWESDVANMRYDDVVAFYQQHYHPGNAILVVVGDVDADEVVDQVKGHFAALPGKPPTPIPHTLEPEQNGERRIRLQGDLDNKYLKVVYRAPAAGSPEYAAFLLTQELLGGGSGVSFLQNDWGTPVRSDSPLANIPGDISTWFPPSAQDYVFVISGVFPDDAVEAEIEKRLARDIAIVQQVMTSNDELAELALTQARQAVLRALVFDVQTTEDAAHQLAFFEGLDALDNLLRLPQALGEVTPADISRVMSRYLRPDQRSIAWYVPSQETEALLGSPESDQAALELANAMRQAANDAAIVSSPPQPPFAQAANASLPILPIVKVNKDALSQTPTLPWRPGNFSLSNGIPVLVQSSHLSPSARLRVVTRLAEFPAGSADEINRPAWWLSALDYDVLPNERDSAIERAMSALADAGPVDPLSQANHGDPSAVLESYFNDILGVAAPAPPLPLAPVLIVISGDLRSQATVEKLEAAFGSTTAAWAEAPDTLDIAGDMAGDIARAMDIESVLPAPAAQLQIGYIVRAPAPSEPQAAAWQMALYILSHHYEGRLGTEAISKRGLVYYIESAYRSDGRNGWITLSTGVDPDNVDAMKQLLRETLDGMVSNPPSQQEVNEARNHLLGRHISQSQSNPEWVDQITHDWLWYGRPIDHAELQQALGAVQREDVIALLPAFIDGTTVTIRNPDLSREP